jgi:hypothetical protein
MILFLSWILPWIRTSGWLERDEARRHRGHTGIVVGFRGPKAGMLGSQVALGWNDPGVAVDGTTVIETTRSDGRPRWCPVAPGRHTVTIVPTHDASGPAVSCEVEVVDGPVIVAVWPKYQRFADMRDARIEQQCAVR